MLKGFNVGGWFSQSKLDYDYFDVFMTELDFKQIKSWGAGSVRIPFDYYTVINSTNPLQYNEKGISYLKKAVSWAKKYELKPIVDFHITSWHYFMDGESKEIPFFSNPQDIQGHIDILEYVMKDYKNDPGVYLEILNEPFAPDHLLVNQFYSKTIQSLRSHGYTLPIVIEPNELAVAQNIGYLQEFTNMENIIFSFHFYKPEFFTHQKAAWTKAASPSPVTYPYTDEKGIVNKDRLIQYMQPVLDFKKKYNVELFCGEFGVYHQAAPQYRYKWITDVLDIFKENDIGWLFWNYKNLDFGIVNTQFYSSNYNEYDNPERTDYTLLELLKRYL